MKKIILLLLLIFVTTPSYLLSDDQVEKALTSQIWHYGDLFYPFRIEPSTKALISKKCVESQEPCLALKAVKNKLKMEFSELQLAGGKNPSSLLCSQGFHGTVLIFKDSKGNENSFCQFPDLSMVRANDLR